MINLTYIKTLEFAQKAFIYKGENIFLKYFSKEIRSFKYVNAERNIAYPIYDFYKKTLFRSYIRSTRIGAEEFKKGFLDD